MVTAGLFSFSNTKCNINKVVFNVMACMQLTSINLACGCVKNICYGSISHWYKKMYNFREGILFHIFPVLILFKNNFLLLIVCSTDDVCFGCYMIIRLFQFIGQNIYEEEIWSGLHLGYYLKNYLNLWIWFTQVYLVSI